uniref:Pseudouridine synthase RsuA/RluA-like domain-containing protein n=1 Tax=Eutreptiella gymnastica TaxID=73025 RepID=A0A7S4CBF2_9EUGL
MSDGGSSTSPWPRPVSPPTVPSSEAHEEELQRATLAKLHKGLPLPDNLIIYEDDWLIALNKPQGWYCEELPDALCNYRRRGLGHCPSLTASQLPGAHSTPTPDTRECTATTLADSFATLSCGSRATPVKSSHGVRATVSVTSKCK